MAEKRPAFQWYPGDFRRDTGVQACSFEARSLWREMLDLMHDGEPRGHLTAGGAPITAEQLARMVGVNLSRLKKWLRELEERQVFSRTDAGVIYSRRMVKDEHIRIVRADAGKLGAEAGARGGRPPDAQDLPQQNGSKATSKTGANARANLKQKNPPAVAVAVAVKNKSNSDRRSPVASWVVEGTDWWVPNVGAMSYPRFGKALSQVVERHTWPVVFPALREYVVDAKAKGKPAKLEWFAAEVVRWIEWAQMPATDEDGILTPRGRAIVGAAS